MRGGARVYVRRPVRDASSVLLLDPLGGVHLLEHGLKVLDEAGHRLLRRRARRNFLERVATEVPQPGELGGAHLDPLRLRRAAALAAALPLGVALPLVLRLVPAEREESGG